MSLPFIIGITGKMGAGKSTITKEVQSNIGTDYCEVLELDKMFKETVFLDPIYRESINKLFEFDFFANDVFDSESFINTFRKYPTRHFLLGQLISMMMYREIIETIELSICPVIIIESSTMFSSPLSLICNTIIDVFCPSDIRWGRVTKRDSHRNIDLTESLFEYNSCHVLEPFREEVDGFSYNNYSWADDTIEKIEKHLTEKGVYDLVKSHIEAMDNIPKSTTPTFISYDFMRGKDNNTNGLSYSKILEYSYSDLELKHNYIQWIFPLPEVSVMQPDSPIISIKQIEDLRTEKVVLMNLERATLVMRRFYRSNHLWMSPHNHNFLRITRIIKCLNLFGLHTIASLFYQEILSLLNYNRFDIPETTWKYWKDASQITLKDSSILLTCR